MVVCQAPSADEAFDQMSYKIDEEDVDDKTLFLGHDLKNRDEIGRVKLRKDMTLEIQTFDANLTLSSIDGPRVSSIEFNYSIERARDKGPEYTFSINV